MARRRVVVKDDGNSYVWVRVLSGFNYGPENTRVEAGEVVNVPELVALALFEMHAAERTEAPGNNGDAR